MKRGLFLLIGIFILLWTGFAFADEVEVSVRINGQYVQDDAHHYLMDQRVSVVARHVVEALGGEVTWIEETQEIHIQYLEMLIKMQIDNPVAYVNDVEIPLDAPPFVKNGRTYIPLRFVAETFTCDVNWIQDIYTVEITKEDFVLPEAFVYNRPYTDDDLIWLARIIQVESPGGSQTKKMAVANVVLNRVKSARFPSTIYEVIYAANQFPPTRKESFATLTANLSNILAAKRALEGNNPIEDCLFFNNRPFTSKKDDFYQLIEGDYFYH